MFGWEPAGEMGKYLAQTEWTFTRALGRWKNSQGLVWCTKGKDLIEADRKKKNPSKYFIIIIITTITTSTTTTIITIISIYI